MAGVVFLCCCGPFAPANRLAAQDFSGLGTATAAMKIVLTRLFPETPEFSAKATMAIYNTNGSLQMGIPMNLILTSNCVREDIDVMTMSQIPAEQREILKQAHLDRMVFLTRVDAKMIYTAFPGVKAYSSLPIQDELLSELRRDAREIVIQRTELGQETFNGLSCTKIKLTVSESNKPPEIAVLWNAPELQKLPVKMECVWNRHIVQFQFGSVQTSPIRPSVLEIPANYTQFTNDAAIIKYAIGKIHLSTNSPPK